MTSPNVPGTLFVSSAASVSAVNAAMSPNGMKIRVTVKMSTVPIATRAYMPR